jgi:DNA-directed RNA polymerase specialized sigma24 family protein
MTINYRKAYLTDGTQVKITEELLRQLCQWEQEGYEISFQYIDMLKKEDNALINAERKYYRHNISLNAQLLKEHINPELMCNKEHSMDEQLQMKEQKKQIMQILKLCTEVQRRRFIKHYYLGFSYAEIAKLENCSKQSVHESIVTVEKLLINCEHFE